MRFRELTRELRTTAVLSLLFGFFLAAGARLNNGGYLGYGVEHAALDASINWLHPGIYIETLLYALLAFAVLMLLWRALDFIAQARARRMQQRIASSSESPAAPSTPPASESATTETPAASETALASTSPAPTPTASETALASASSTPKPTALLIPVKKRWFWICAALLICCWLPYWLGLWPGIYNYDAHYQYEMLVGGYLQTHHPLMHTFLLDGFVLLGENYLGSFNIGVELYIGLGLMVCALAFSWMLFTMAEEGAGKVLLICSFLFLAINPALVIWLVSTNKDVLFSAFLLLTAVLLYRICRPRPGELPVSKREVAPGNPSEEKHQVSYDTSHDASHDATPTAHQTLNSVSPDQTPKAPSDTGSGSTEGKHRLHVGAKAAWALFWLLLAVLCFRTSALYSLIAFLLFAAPLIRRKLRIRLMSIMGLATAVFLILYLVLVEAVFQVPSGPWQSLDALSIPRQQLARIWVQAEDPSDISAFEQVFNKESLDYLDEYEADDADTSRSAFRAPFEQNPSALLKLYLDMGIKYPGAYTDAALLTSYEAWYPGAVIDGYFYQGYFPNANTDRASYIDVSAFSPAQEEWILEDFGEWLRQFGLGNVGISQDSQDILPMRMLCSPAVYMWLLLIALARAICLRDKRGALVCTLLLIFGLTALLSPLVVMRYYLMVMVALPLIVHIMTSPRQAATYV